MNTQNEKATSKNIFDDLQSLTQLLPTPTYWLNTDGILLGGNDCFYQLLGINPDYIGRTEHDIYPKEIADRIVSHDKQVMSTGIHSSQEEQIKDLHMGKTKYFSAFKAPLKDKEGKIIGLIGSLIDITAQKEAELLRIENEQHLKMENAAQKTKIEEQEKFAQIANQLSHDIRSPLAAMKMWYESIKKKINEEERITGRNALNRATDILDSGFFKYKPAAHANASLNQKKSVMIFSALEQIIAEKRLEYHDQPVTLEIYCEPSAVFACFGVADSDFKRMISNLINNAVDAFEKHPGVIQFYLQATGEAITLQIKDNGKGIPASVRKMIENNMVATVEKVHNNGIGFTQIREILKAYGGQFSITSKKSVGTTITLTFSQIKAPDWLADSIVLRSTDCIVIIDDDPSIHAAWDMRFREEAPANTVKHFESGEEAMHYINSFAPQEKSSLFLLTDYELLNQPMNGLDIVEKTGVKRALLVTSHSENETVRKRALSLNTFILPKQLAVHVPMTVIEEKKSEYSAAEVVIVDDDRELINLLQIELSHKKIDKYYSPEAFLDNMHRYAKKTTAFCIDNHFRTSQMSGIDLAKKLYQQGFPYLYLFTGRDLSGEDVPGFLHVISKTQPEYLIEILQANAQETEVLATEVVIIDDEAMILEGLVPLLFSNCRVETFTSPEEGLAKLSRYNKDTVFLVDNHFATSVLTGIQVLQQLKEGGFHRLYLLSGAALDLHETPEGITAVLKTDIERLKEISHLYFNTSSQQEPAASQALPQNAEIVLINEERDAMHRLEKEIFSDRRVDKYYKPEDFFAQQEKYDKQTLICINDTFSKSSLTGLTIAERLYEQGFGYLYVLSDDPFIGETTPMYVKIVKKADTARLIGLNTHWKRQTLANASTQTKERAGAQASSMNPSMIDTLLHHLSHEVLNNLSAIQINADLIQMFEEMEESSSGERKQHVIKQIENIKQSRKECVQTLRMEIAKLRAEMHLPIAAPVGIHSITRTIETALAEYPFRVEERAYVDYTFTTNFDYQGDTDTVKQILFHSLKQGLSLIQQAGQGKITFYCLAGEKFHQLIVRNTATDVSGDPSHVSAEQTSLETKLSWTFCQSMMHLLKGKIESRTVSGQFSEIVFYFPKA